jgi:hypothetical protein
MTVGGKGKRVVLRAVLVGALAIAGLGTAALAHPGSSGAEQACRGGGMGRGGGHGGADMMGIHFLFAHRDAIQRNVTEIPGGVRTTTESDDPTVAAQLRDHVRAMYARLKGHQPINARDPLFAALFRNADKIQVVIEDTDKGVRVTETSSDADVTKLIRRHAKVVGLFIANGMHEMMQSH